MMNPFNFIRAASEIYFEERDKIRHRSKRWWILALIAFFALYLWQVEEIYANWTELAVRQAVAGETIYDLDEIWRMRASVIGLQGIVLGGIFLRFLAGQFRGRWFVRFGELAELIALAAFLNHAAWTHEVYSQPGYAHLCGLPSLIGLTHGAGQWLGFFFYCWILYKAVWLIVVAIETARKWFGNRRA